MSKDYAKKSATKNPPPQTKRRIPGFIWLLTGFGLGAFSMFLIQLATLGPGDNPTLSTANTEAEKKVVPKPRFDFYRILKENEVPVTTSTFGKDNLPDLTEEKVEYILQAGSFKRAEDADRLRGQLILLNLDAKVEEVTVRNGGTWHRVLVGPYQSRSRMAEVRSILVSKNINPLLLKQKL